jgi:hypothetical protein
VVVEMVLKQLPYGVQTGTGILRDAENWCMKQWGPRWEVAGDSPGTWYVVWGSSTVEMIPSYYRWWFATKEQQMWFSLKWS